MTHGIVIAPLVIRQGCFVQKQRVIPLGERIDRHMPVGLDLDGPVSDLFTGIKESLVAVMHDTEPLLQGLTGLFFEIHKDKGLPNLAVNRNQSVIVFIESKELGLIGDAHQLAPRRIIPAMKLTGKGFFHTPLTHLQFIGAVATNIVKSPHLAITAPHHHNGRLERRHVDHDETAGFWQLGRGGDGQPRFLKNLVDFAFEIIGLNSLEQIDFALEFGAIPLEDGDAGGKWGGIHGGILLTWGSTQ